MPLKVIFFLQDVTLNEIVFNQIVISQMPIKKKSQLSLSYKFNRMQLFTFFLSLLSYFISFALLFLYQTVRNKKNRERQGYIFLIRKKEKKSCLPFLFNNIRHKLIIIPFNIIFHIIPKITCYCYW
jgi:hypothetical protein